MKVNKWEDALFCAALAYILVIFSSTLEQNVRTFTVTAMFLALITILWVISNSGGHFAANKSLYRQKTSCGIFLVLLVPMTLLGEVVAAGKLDEKEIELWLSLVTSYSCIARFVSDLGHQKLQLFFFIALGGFITLFITGWFSVLVAFDFIVTWKGIELVPRYLQHSFTHGELSIALQLIVGWSDRLVLTVFKSSSFAEEDQHLLWFVYTLVVAVVLATWTVYVTSSNHSLVRFLAVYTIFAMMSLVVLFLRQDKQPILWLINFLIGSCSRVYLLSTWVVLLAVTVLWTVTRGLALQPPVHEISAGSSQENEEETKKLPRAHSSQHLQRLIHKDVDINLSQQRTAISFTTRKVFHVFIVLVYIPGIMLDTPLLLFASLAVFGLFIIVEAARAFQVPMIGEYLDNILRTFVDDRDQGTVFLTHIYLLVGMSLPLWISHKFSSSKSSIEMYSGVLSLGVGDTIACVAGRALGRIHWPGSNKTVEGTLFSIAAQMLLVILGIYCDIVVVKSLVTVHIGISLCALVEALTDQIDNLVLPLVLYPFLCIS